MTNKRGITVPPARVAALQCLSLVLDRGMELQPALDTILRSSGDRFQSDSSPVKQRGTVLDPRDKGLATELCYGYLRYKRRIDFLLQSFLKNPAKVPKPVMRVLGLGLYELMALDRVPAYATLNWCADAIKKNHGQGLAGMSNAVLRRATRELDHLLEPEYYRNSTTSDLDFLQAFYSCPKPIISILIQSCGKQEAQQILKATLSTPPVGLRFNQRRPGSLVLYEALTSRSKDQGTPLVAEPHGLAFNPADIDFAQELEPSWSQGLVSRQSLASLQALDQTRPETWEGPVWDACAGHGGKTCALLESQDYPLMASDPNRGRIHSLKLELRRLGLPDIPVFQARAEIPAPFTRQLGAILIDAPCSGLGVLSRRPDIKHRFSGKRVRGVVALQKAILENAHTLVRPEGHIAYMTCTLNREENQNQVRGFLNRNSDMVLEQEWTTPFDTVLKEFFYCALMRRK